MFKKGVEFYHAQLNFNFVNILKELEDEILIAKEHKNANLKRKEDKLKEMLAALDFENEFGVCIEENIKTMRDLPIFGINTGVVNFRFPTDADLRAMPKGKPIETIKLNWKPSSAGAHLIGALQAIYSNGTASPVFLARG